LAWNKHGQSTSWIGSQPRNGWVTRNKCPLNPGLDWLLIWFWSRSAERGLSLFTETFLPVTSNHTPLSSGRQKQLTTRWKSFYAGKPAPSFCAFIFIMRRSTRDQPKERLKTSSSILLISFLPYSSVFLDVSFWFKAHESNQKQQRMKMWEALLMFLPLKHLSFLIFHRVHKTAPQPTASRFLSFLYLMYTDFWS
jgi:hypothetical protein